MKANRLLETERRKLNRAIAKIIKPIYFDSIPICTLFNELVLRGFTPLQEDNTSWSGLLCGETGSVLIRLGRNDSQTKKDGITFYAPLDNGLALQWHKMPSGKYEVNAYIS